MAIDHLVFNKLKWFNISNSDQQITANGKKWGAYPASVKLNGTGALSTDLAWGNVIGTPNCECYAKIINEFGTYYLINYEGRMAFIQDDQVASENWGGNSPLSHVYQWLRSLYRMVVISW